MTPLVSIRGSTENAAIIVKCARFPLIIDPQLQAIVWISNREEPNGLVKLTLGSKNYVDKVARAMEEGLPLLIENMGETIDAVLDNMVARAFTKKGSKLGVKLGDRDCDVMVLKDADGVNTQDPAFRHASRPSNSAAHSRPQGLSVVLPRLRLYMQTKLPNPHYIPEVWRTCIESCTHRTRFTLACLSATDPGADDRREFHRDRKGPRGPAPRHRGG